MKNKKGMSALATILTVFLCLASLGGVGYGAYKLGTGGTPQNAVDKANAVVDATGCTIAPSVNLLPKNTLVTGTTPTVTANYTIYKGSYVGTPIPSSLSKKASLDVLATATNYLNTENSIDSLTCDSNDLELNFVPYQIPTYTVLDDSYNVLTDAATAVTLVNISASANQITAQIKINGVPDKSTGDMLICIDYANKTEVTTSGISLADATRVDTPSWFSPAGTASSIACFTIPALVDGGSKTYTLTLTPESGKTMGGQGTGVLTTIYTLNPVILDAQTGTFQKTNTWKNSLNADMTIASVDYDFYIDA